MALRVIKTIDFKITSRELLWMKIFTASMEAGFSCEQAVEETERAVDTIFDTLDARRCWGVQGASQPFPISVNVSKDLGSS